MTLPLYILRRQVEPGGVRLKPRPALLPDVAGKCASCHQYVYNKKIYSCWQLDGYQEGENLYHYGCRPFHVVDMRRVNGVKVPKGNLGEEEYRFWIGSEMTGSQYAMCRACRTSTYSAAERVQHMDDPKFRVGGDQCTTRLTNAYKVLECLQHCIVCKNNRFNKSRWGVPLCDRPDCIRRWKFETSERWLPLEARLQAQKNKAGALLVNKPPRSWCRVCGMFSDVQGHDEIHIARLNSGNWVDGGFGED